MKFYHLSYKGQMQKVKLLFPHLQGKVTLYRGCSFHPQSRFSEYQESLTLQEGEGSVWCDCDVTFPGEDSDKQRSITSDFNGICYLTVIRCSSQE